MLLLFFVLYLVYYTDLSRRLNLVYYTELKQRHKRYIIQSVYHYTNGILYEAYNTKQNWYNIRP